LISFFCEIGHAGTTKKELDKLYVAVPNGFESLDPLKAAIAQEWFVLPLIYEYLFRYNSKDEIIPDLAEVWAFQEDTSTIRIKIREGHFFSDGSKVDAKSVVQSITAYCLSTTPSAVGLRGLVGCSGANNRRIKIRAVSDYNVEMVITMAPSAFIYQLTAAPMAVLKRDKNHHALGSGPYRLESLLHDMVVLKKNDFFSRLTSSPSPSQLVIQYIAEDAIGKELKKNNLDVASMYLTSSKSQLENPNYVVIPQAAHVTQVLVLNPNVVPFKDPKLRKVIRDAIYESEISTCAEGRMPAIGLIPTGVGGSIANDRSVIHGPIAAKNHKLALKNPVHVEIFQHIGRKNICDEMTLKHIFANFNIFLNFRYVDNYSELDKLYVDKSTPAYIELFVFLTRDASRFLSRFTPHTTEPLFFYTDPKIEELVNKALNLGEIKQRFLLYRLANTRIEEKSSTVALYYIGHTNTIRRCRAGKSPEQIGYSPNSFLFLIEGGLADDCGEPR